VPTHVVGAEREITILQASTGVLSLGRLKQRLLKPTIIEVKVEVGVEDLLHCALASCNRSCLWVYDSGRAVSEPYYSQRARSVCVSLSAFFIYNRKHYG